jgi:hypothetical protein
MRKVMLTAMYIFVALTAVWVFLTVWAQRTGPKKTWALGHKNTGPVALVVFNPDPFYNLDEQISLSFGRALSEYNFQVQVVTVAATSELYMEPELLVLCTNTYNLRPDRPISNFIKQYKHLKGKRVVAITLGAGSTGAAQQSFESLIKENGGEIIDSKSFWLMRPNDESRMEESNIAVANDMAYHFGGEIAKRIDTAYHKK